MNRRCSESQHRIESVGSSGLFEPSYIPLSLSALIMQEYVQRPSILSQWTLRCGKMPAGVTEVHALWDAFTEVWAAAGLF